MSQGLKAKLNLKVKQMERTFEERSWRRVARDIRDYIVPDRGRFLDADRTTDEANKNKTDTNRDLVIDDEGERALSLLVSLFMSMLVPSDVPWMRLRIEDPNLEGIQRVNVWLDSVTSLILRIFRQADMYGVMHNTFTEFCSFATGCQLLDSDENDVIMPRSFTFGEYLILNGPDMMPNTFAHKSYFTAKQLKEKFGEDRMSATARQHLKIDGNRDKLFLVWHLIEPVENSENITNPAGMPFNSIWWEWGTDGVDVDKMLKVGGYEEFPVQTPRWNIISNDTYGKESPGMKQLGNIKMLQSMVEDAWVITKRLGDPPMIGNIDQDGVNTLPGGWTYGVDMAGGKPSVQPLFDGYNPDLNAIYSAIEVVTTKIKSGFYNQFAVAISDTPDTKRMTATEIMARKDEEFAMLGPILNRVFKEMLRPQIERTFNILKRQGWFDADGDYPVPPELVDREFDIEFESVLARAQKNVNLNELDRYLERAAMAAQVLGPDALDAINPDELMNVWGRTVPAIVQNGQDVRDQLREARAQQQAALSQMAAMESAAKTTKDLAGSPVGTGSALDEMGEEEA